MPTHARAIGERRWGEAVLGSPPKISEIALYLRVNFYMFYIFPQKILFLQNIHPQKEILIPPLMGG